MYRMDFRLLHVSQPLDMSIAVSGCKELATHGSVYWFVRLPLRHIHPSCLA